MRKRIAVGVPDHLFGRSRVADEVSLSQRIAPRALGIPVPGLHKQISVLPITDDAPSCGEDLLDLVGPEKRIRGIAGYPVDRRTQRVKRTKLVGNVSGGRVHAHSLRSCALQDDQQERNRAQLLKQPTGR